MATLPDKELSIAFDLHGCPNRCRHCYLGCATGRRMDLDEAVRRFLSYRHYAASGAASPLADRVRFFGTWFREPDFADNYRDLFETEIALNGGTNYRKDYELLSIWRLARDESYARWARETGVTRCQVTLFGMEETTDWFCRRKGAFGDVIGATRRMLDNGIVPRWQLFLTTKIIPELADLLDLTEQLRLVDRSRAVGKEFVVFLHDPSPTGEALNLESLRIGREDLRQIPRELIAATLDHMKLTDPYRTEADWLSQIRAEADRPIGVQLPTVAWFLVDSDWDVYPNLMMMSMEPWWELGNMIQDPPDAIVSRYLRDESPGQRALREVSARSLAARHGNPTGDRIYMSKDDLLGLYLERHLECS